MELEIATPRWAVPLLRPARYKGAKGGRGSGKSHFFAELAVETMVINPDHRFVCIREVQKSLKFSVKQLVESKIRALGVSDLFEITLTEIRRIGGNGIMIFQGMQDHTADSIKSLEGFNTAWVEEAQNLSRRSLELLLPTIRAEGSEIWFSWNPDQPTDPVDAFFCGEDGPPPDSVLVHVNYTDNPFLPSTLKAEAERHLLQNPDTFPHVWLGEYNTKSDAQVFNGKWTVEEFDISTFGDKVKGPCSLPDGPYYGADWGFAQDPTVGVRCWIWQNRLYIDHEVGAVGVDISDTAELLTKLPGADKHVIRGDSARPETISHLRKPWVDSSGEKRPGLRIEPCEKWPGSVEDGITFLRSFDKIVIHPRCKGLLHEAVHYRYKVDRLTGDVLPQVVDANNHYWDAVRYALGPMIRASRGGSKLAAWL